MASSAKRKSTKITVALINGIFPVLMAFIIGGVVISLAKENPLDTYWTLFSKSLFDPKGLMKTLHYASPLVLTGFAIAITFKAGIFNMGVEGQLLVGGFTATICGTSLGFLPAPVLIPLCLGVGIVSGVLTAIIPALLRAFYNVNEMVVTLLLNYAIMIFLEYLTSGPFRNPGSGYVSTHMVEDSAIFVRMWGTKLTLFTFIVAAVFILMYIVFKKSKLGYEVEAIGKNPLFSEAVGMNVRYKIIVIMVISGALSGLAGAGWLLSEKYAYTLSFSGAVGLGWDGMLIALLGAHSPVGILFAAIFYATLKVGVQNISIFTQVPSEIIALIQAMIILFLSVKVIKDEHSRVYKKIDSWFERLGSGRTA